MSKFDEVVHLVDGNEHRATVDGAGQGDELGRVVIPIELRGRSASWKFQELELSSDEDKIILKKYLPNMTCAVTGEVSDDNFRLVGGKLILSPEGADLLVKEIQSNQNK